METIAMTATVVAAAPTVKTAAPAPPRWWVELLGGPAEIAPHCAAWDDLAQHAVEPNPFYERWMLLPAWRTFGLIDQVQLALVYRDGTHPEAAPELCGLFPLRQRQLGHMPLRVWSLWRNQYTYLCTPLLRQGAARETLQFFWNWLGHHAGGPGLWKLPHVNGDGPFQQTLIDVTNDRHASCHILYRYNRAVLRPASSAEAYCAAAMTSHNRQELRRQHRRLSERGRLEFRETSPADDVSSWIEQFLQLEAAGWKGREQTAIAAGEADADYFRTIVAEGVARGQAGFLGLFLDGQPIALKVNFFSGEGSFAFKIAFDESLAKFSPGVQLELENINWLHRRPAVKWMDSCAKADHFMINRLWRDRRTIQDLVVSTGTIRGDLALGLLPFAHAVKSVAVRCVTKPGTRV